MCWNYIIFCFTCIFNNVNEGTQIFLAMGSSYNAYSLIQEGLLDIQPCFYKSWMNM
jgi:hypothetical protein